MLRSTSFAVLILLLAACGGHETDEAASSTTKAEDPRGLAALDAWIAENPATKSEPNWRLFLPCPLWDVDLDPTKEYRWKLETTRGDMTFELFSDRAPKHVMSVAYLSRIGFYDGLSFHRVITGFMAQGGCPKGDGSAGPGYEFHGEFHPKNPGHEAAGMLSTANIGRPGTDGSQFFITFRPTPHLDGKHTVFGRLIEGEEVLRRLEKVGSPEGTPTAVVKIVKATIIER